jgi:hypothetical protein
VRPRELDSVSSELESTLCKDAAEARRASEECANIPITIFTSVRDRSPALTIGETYNITIPPGSIHVLEG